jgi:hypothetical protein
VTSRPSPSPDPGRGPDGSDAGGRVSTLTPTAATPPPPPIPVASPAPAPPVAPERPAPSDRTTSELAPAPIGSTALARPVTAALATPMAEPLATPAPASGSHRPDDALIAPAPVAVLPAVLVSVTDSEESGLPAPRRAPGRVHWLVRFLVWLAALALAAVAVLVPYRRFGIIDFDGALNVIGGRGFERWKLPLIIVPPWAFLSAVLAHFSIEGIARWNARSARAPASATVATTTDAA